MPDIIDRTGAAARIPEDYSAEVWEGAKEKSAALTMFRHRTMTAAEQRMPALAGFPTAYFRNGDNGLMTPSNVSWENVYLEAEPIDVLVPIPKTVLADSKINWTEIRPLCEQAIAVAIDNAAFFGIGKPPSWPVAIAVAAAAAGNSVVRGTSAIDIADDINNAIILMEADGFDFTGSWSNVGMKGRLRGLRTSDKNLLFQPTGPANTGVSKAAFVGQLWNEKYTVSKAGLSGFTGSGNPELIVGDWDQGLMGIREDIEFDIWDQATIFNPDGSVKYALPQQGMVALAMTMRVGFAVPNPITLQQQTQASRYPFSVLLAP